MNQTPEFQFDNTYAKLSDKLSSQQLPQPVSEPELIAFNSALAEQLKLNSDALQSPAGLAVLAGNSLPDGAEPIASVYGGHQFGYWAGQLGDGRAILLGEILDKDAVRFDIQLKGAGRTPYSRGGDGRAPVGPIVREYIVSEAMAAMGVPTTRALAAVATGDDVWREEMQPGAILTRVAQSHIRVGTFQYFASRRDNDTIKLLTDHVIDRHYPELNAADNPPLALLESVLTNQARLVSHWQSIGFIHGVMNTDNASVAGLTIDYGPCAFMDDYHPETVFSSIDRGSRYAYKNQPGIAQWNCANLAQCLLPLIDTDEEKSRSAAQAVIDSFPEIFVQEYLSRFRKKLGLASDQDDDLQLVSDLLQIMADAKVDFTNTFRTLSHCSFENDSSETQNSAFEQIFAQPQPQPTSHPTSDPISHPISKWLERWRMRHTSESSDSATRQSLMYQSNPAYIPRNHQIERVIAAATQKDYAPMHTLIKVLANPYKEQKDMEQFSQPPRKDEIVQATFCGT